jgi:hypothetical protein
MLHVAITTTPGLLVEMAMYKGIFVSETCDGESNHHGLHALDDVLHSAVKPSYSSIPPRPEAKRYPEDGDPKRAPALDITRRLSSRWLPADFCLPLA